MYVYHQALLPLHVQQYVLPVTHFSVVEQVDVRQTRTVTLVLNL
jgi:hypothetical protein